MAVYGKQADVDANQGKNVLLYVPGQTKLTANDTFLGGTGTGVSDADLNGAKRIYGNTAQDTANAYNQYLSATQNANGTPKYDPSIDMRNTQIQAQNIANNSMATQKAQLDAALADHINQLQSAYTQAISDGQISIRDAQDAFTKQKAALEQQAYQDAQRTGLVSQDMGIQNSQQMLGMQASDNARNASLNNSNMSERDKQIADINDRLAALKTQQGLDLANAVSQHDYGVATAQGQVNSQLAQNLFNLNSDQMKIKQEQQYAQDNLATQQQYQQQNMATQNQYQQQNMATQHQYDVENMFTQNKLDLGKMSQQFDNDVKMAAVQYGYQSSLQSQSASAQLDQIKANLAGQLQIQQAKYQADLNNQLASFTKGTPEYTLRQAQLNDANNAAKQEIYAKAQAEAQITLSKSPAIATPTAPTDYTAGGADQFGGSILNYLSGYDSKKSEYDKQMQAIKDRQAAIDAVKGK